jgi:uncharacterized protein YdaU (DUF1376 family)
LGENKESGRETVAAASTSLTNQPSEEVGVAPAHSKRSPAFQWYPSDFFSSAKVDRMAMTERGAYITLLSRCWLDDGLSTDLTELAQICRMKPAQFERMWQQGQIGKCFVERGGKLRNRRLDDEHQKQVDYRRRQSDHGKRGGRPPAKGFESQPFSDKQGSERSPISSSSLISSSSSEKRGAPIIRRRRMDAAYEHEGGIYVPQRAHDDFTALHPGEDLIAWYEAVCAAWVGRNTGADMFRFWKARHDEKWMPEQADRRTPAWAR